MKRYVGEGGVKVGPIRVWVERRDDDGGTWRRVGLLKHRLRHSPDGFQIGYGGSGPADLARSILWDVLDSEPEPIVYHAFKFDVIAKLTGGESFVIYESDVRAWLDTRDSTLGEWPEFAARARERGWHDPKGARGACSVAAHEFVVWLGEGDVWGSHDDRHAVAVLADGRAVDWTARQFDSDAAFPAIYASLEDAFLTGVPEHLFSADSGIDWESIVGTPEEWATDRETSDG